MQLNQMTLNAQPLTKTASSVAVQATNNSTTRLQAPAKMEESVEANNGHSGTPQNYDFTNMTYKQLNVAAEDLYDKVYSLKKSFFC